MILEINVPTSFVSLRLGLCPEVLTFFQINRWNKTPGISLHSLGCDIPNSPSVYPSIYWSLFLLICLSSAHVHPNMSAHTGFVSWGGLINCFLMVLFLLKYASKPQVRHEDGSQCWQEFHLDSFQLDFLKHTFLISKIPLYLLLSCY